MIIDNAIILNSIIMRNFEVTMLYSNNPKSLIAIITIRFAACTGSKNSHLMPQIG